MSTEPRRSVQVKLSIRTKLTQVSTIYSINLRKVALALAGKANLAALFAWCQKEGVGLDGFHLGLIPGGGQGELWIDGRRRNGLFIDRIGEVVARLEDGKVTEGDASWATWLALLPSTAPIEWGKAKAPATPKKEQEPPLVKPVKAVKETLSARVDLELTSRAQVEKLSPVLRRQLEAASKNLCGKKGLAALLKSCDAQAQGLAHLKVSSGKTVRFEGWLTAALEDGVFFDAGQATLNGLAVSQGEVCASETARAADVPALQAAMKKLSAPPAPRWKG